MWREFERYAGWELDRGAADRGAARARVAADRTEIVTRPAWIVRRPWRIVPPMWILTNAAFAGLGPASVVVLYNSDVPEAAAVAEHYAAARSLPTGHLCGLTGIDPLATGISLPDYEALVRAPFDACIAALPQPDEIDAIVTVRGLPYVVALATPDDYVVGFESALQVGHGTYSGAEIFGSGQVLNSGAGFFAASVRNPEFVGVGVPCAASDLTIENTYGANYHATCALQAMDQLPPAFRRAPPHEYANWDLSGELFVVTRLDGFDYDDALALVDRGVAADGAFPSAPLMCMRGADEARAARDPECELTVRRLAEAGVASQWIDVHDPALAGVEVAAYFTGAASIPGAIDGVDYAPGAIVDNLTSVGAAPQNFFCSEDGATCPAYEAQTSIARWVRAGATGVHGAVSEPLNNIFPNAGALILYASGYSLGEAYLYDQEYLYWQNLVLGDPLATPYAERPEVFLPHQLPAGNAVELAATHPDGVQKIRLYLDGVLVAEEDGDSLLWDVTGAPGDEVDVLVVALAGDHTFARPGWPAASQVARPDVQGWAAARLTVVDVIAEEPKACGCASTGPGSSWVLLALGGVAFRGARSRRS